MVVIIVNDLIAASLFGKTYWRLKQPSGKRGAAAFDTATRSRRAVRAAEAIITTLGSVSG